MMNNGFNGTGTAFILYVFLAFCMPIIYLIRLIKRHRNFDTWFVFGHFLLGIVVTIAALLCVGYLWQALSVNKHAHLHNVLLAMGYAAVLMVIMWILIPRIVRGSYRLGRKGFILDYKNPLIHPWQLPPRDRYSLRFMLGRVAARRQVSHAGRKWIDVKQYGRWPAQVA